MPACTPGESRACYAGPEGTEGVGVCVAGTEICLPDGSGFGLCSGERRPERERCGNDLDDDCDGATSCGETRWLARWGSGRDDAAMALDVDPDGNLYLAGYYREAIDFGGGALPSVNSARDLFVAKLDAEGTHRFSLGIASPQSCTPRDLAVVDDRVVFVASVRDTIDIAGQSVPGAAGDDILVLALDLEGEVLWHRRFGGEAADNPGAVARGPAGEILVAGSHQQVLDLDGTLHDAGPNFDAFVMALDPTDGAVLWSRFFDGPHNQIPSAMAADAEGIYLAGDFQGEIDFGDGIHDASGVDAFVVALAPDGSTRWSHRLGGDAEVRAFGVAAGPEGPVVVGRFEGSLDVGGAPLSALGAGFVAAFDADGNPLMSRVLVEAQDGAAYDVAVGADGRPVVVGYYDGLGDDQGLSLFDGGVRVPTLVVQKLTPSGDSVWARTMVVHQNQTASGTLRAYRRLALAPDGAIALAGFVRGSFYDTESEGDADVFAALLEP